MICQKCGVSRFLPQRLVFRPREHPSLFRSTDSCRGPIRRGRARPTTLLRARCAASIFREIENVISEFPPSSARSASSSSSSPAVRCGDRFPADMRQTFNEAHVKSFHRKPEFHVGNVRQASGQDRGSDFPCAMCQVSRILSFILGSVACHPRLILYMPNPRDDTSMIVRIVSPLFNQCV